MEIAVKRKLGRLEIDAVFNGAVSGVTALFGPSGAGKTSIVNMIAGLSRPDSGRITINGKCLFDSENDINLAPEKRRIGYVFQEGRLFPHLSVRGNLVYGMNLVPSPQRAMSFERIVDLLGIGHLLGRRPRHLSGGEKQRVAIGRALLTSPEALLMDEPLASLDNARKEELLPFIAAVGREFTMPILYVSHALHEIRALTDNLVMLREGRVVTS